MNNEVFELISNYLKELQMDKSRENIVYTDEAKYAKEDYKQKKKEYEAWAQQFINKDLTQVNEYIDAMEHHQVEEAQCSYFQGFIDCIQLLSGMGVLKQNIHVNELIDHIKK